MRRSIQLLILLTVLSAGCRWGSDRDEMTVARPPPAAAITPVGRSVSLIDKLARLEDELAATITLIETDAARQRLLRAEAITDGLLEAEMPFGWIEDEAYRVDARLRQIQALADHAVALMRRGASASTLLADVRALHRDVTRLLAVLDTGRGGDPPTSIDSLLAGIGRDDGSAAHVPPAASPAPSNADEEDPPELLGEPVGTGR